MIRPTFSLAVAAAVILACQAGVANAQILGVDVHPHSRGGMHVHHVHFGTRASAIGVQAGDRILSINGYPTDFTGDIGRAVRRADYHGWPLRIVVRRHGYTEVLREYGLTLEYAARPASGRRR